MATLILTVTRAAPIMERFGLAFANVTLAIALLVGAIIAGHELRGWREWYPQVHHPWLDGPLPVAPREPSSSPPAP